MGRGLQSEPALYSLEVLLPEPLRLEANRWLTLWPGATWPPWGAHITLLVDLAASGDDFLADLSQACAQQAPFSVCFDRVVVGDHWAKPGLKTVMLVVDPRRDPDAEALRRLRLDLISKLGLTPEAIWPEVEGRAYRPHISLTAGLPEAAASRLARAVAASKVSVRFVVDEIWLLQIDARAQPEQQEERPVCSFPLGIR
jgi:hypothetical protein